MSVCYIFILPQFLHYLMSNIVIFNGALGQLLVGVCDD